MNEDVTVGRIGPPQPGQGVGQETQQYGSGDQAVDEGDPALDGEYRIGQATPGRPLPATRANITTAVTAVQAMASAA
ncbi:hypothetical protein [Streptomyces sp. MUSC 14]|uniref:hypothetical protein n=1 Tax=Streptomyces sp. MUSC 14 TaxID=1354889 RepID=UPI0015A52B3B|nr:hypothetical protein [Streptomyces sp. MUSC 14]